MTPIPGGDITSTETWTEVPVVTDEAIVEADAEIDTIYRAKNDGN